MGDGWQATGGASVYQYPSSHVDMTPVKRRLKLREGALAMRFRQICGHGANRVHRWISSILSVLRSCFTPPGTPLAPG